MPTRRSRFSSRALSIAAVIGLALVAKCTCGPSAPPPLAGTTWQARLDLDDYLESVSFGGGGKGTMLWGSSQTIRDRVPFTYEEHGPGDVEIRYPYRGGPPPLRVRFGVREGEFRFRRETHVGPVTVVCRREIDFASAPFPGRKTRAYYDGCTISR